MSFLPKDYEFKEAGSEYYKFDLGDNKFRILTDAVIGVEGWKDNKPFRRGGPDATIDESEVDVDQKYGKPKINHFWAFYVWDYKNEKVAILELTQKSIQKALNAYASDADWGHPQGYDIVVTKEDNGGRVSYTVKTVPPKPLAAKVQAVVDEATPTFDIVKALSIEEVS